MSWLGMDKRTLYMIIVLGIMGILMLLFATRSGIGLGVDSLHYIGASRSLLRGYGLTRISYQGELVPMVHWPPLFPLLLALLGAVGIDPLEGARWLNAILFGANIVLVGIVIQRQVRSSIWPSLFGSFLMLTSVNMLRTHSMALTEPAFIFFSLSGLFLLATYVENARSALLIASSVAIALAFLTRYLGIVLVITGAVGLLSLNKKTFPRRVFDCVLFGTISSLPMIVWIIRNHIVAGGISDMGMAFHPVTLEHVRGGLNTLSLWIVPERTPYLIRMFVPVVLTVSFVCGVLLLRHLGKPDAGDEINNRLKVRPLLAIFVFVYCVALVFFISFVSLDISFSPRYLSPVYVSVIILVVCLGSEVLRFAKRIRPLHHALIAVCITFAGYSLVRDAIIVIITSRDGQGYASKSWKHSETLRKASTLPADIRIYSNGYNLIYYLTGRPAFPIPVKYDQHSGLLNDKYQSEVDLMKKHFGSQRAALVYFSDNYRPYLPSEKELREALPLSLIDTEVDGSIYEIETEPGLVVGR